MLSSEFKQRFCSFFNINDLADAIQVLVDVDNEEASTELLNFYVHSIDLIQNFLLTNNFMSESRSSYLQTVFSRLKFVAVDGIRLSYRHGEHIVRKASSASTLDSYIDESMGKFYILKKYQTSESRHIDSIVNYLVSDEAAYLKLSHYIRFLLKIYQDEGIEGLTKYRETLPKHTLPIWEIPTDIKRKSSSSSSEEESTQNDDHTEIPAEMLLKLQNQPGWHNPKLGVNPIEDLNPREDSNQTKSLTCFPAKANLHMTIESVNRKQPSQSQLQTTDSVQEIEVMENISTTNPENNTLSSISIPTKNENPEQTNTNNDDKNSVQRHRTSPNDSECHKNDLILIVHKWMLSMLQPSS